MTTLQWLTFLASLANSPDLITPIPAITRRLKLDPLDNETCDRLHTVRDLLLALSTAHTILQFCAFKELNK